MTQNYLPSVHDPELIRLHAKQFHDYQLADILGFSTQTIRANLRRLGLPSHKLPPAKIKFLNTEKAVPVPRDRANPLTVARRWLGDRLTETPQGYRLDNVPASLDTIMRAANARLKASGEGRIEYSPRWRV
jgi:hypothetical protein